MVNLRAVTMFREEDVGGLFKVASPNLVMGAISTALTFGFFELYCKMLKDSA